ncbi:uncharacterized protein ATC70_000443 [Mucor velutinosus]|uniref:Uncharacterized protein n=1 Tax=Mucor velutinosus TaxID=708070 RepID=A0AAN7DHI3_9FUNG|nr:hypothetical protein ATC70_000443 [Mucor velutinosus]
MPSHLGSPFSAASSKSSKSSKSLISSSGTIPRRVLSELRSRSHNNNAITVSVSVTTTAGEFFSPTSAQASSYLLGSTVTTPREPTRGERLEAPYNRFDALPTASRQATSESTASYNEQRNRRITIHDITS